VDTRPRRPNLSHGDSPLPPLTLPDSVRAALDLRLDPASRAPLAVAFSGGGDSLALLLAARDWADTAGRPVLALTVDHRLQPQSRAWTLQAEQTAARLGVGFRALAWEGLKPERGLAAAARRARHALLADAAREAGARVILMGHTLDDLLEGEVMRAEGSSLGVPREWSPSPVWPRGRGVFLLRSLLGVRRAELRAALAPTGLDWIEDPANEDVRHARSRARKALAGGSAEQAWGRAMTQTGGPLEALAERATVDRFGVIRIARAVLAAADDAAARRVLAAACLCAGGGERPPRPERVERLRLALSTDSPVMASLAGARVDADGETVTILRNAGEVARGGLAPLRLEAGATGVFDGRFEVRAPGAVRILAMKGSAARLPPGERARLRAAPPAARPGLPVIEHGQTVTCPLLQERPSALVRCLVGSRLGSACGLFDREARIGGGAHGETTGGALS
jgi:tRNA(Ile)-lysidine synthase